jgi:hypothetical protein
MINYYFKVQSLIFIHNHYNHKKSFLISVL